MNGQTMGVIGAGTMGQGIAQTAALAGLQVVLLDVAAAALERAQSQVQNSLARMVKKGSITAEAAQAAAARIQTTTEYAALAPLPFVIEAATENPAIKVAILQKLDAVLGAQAIVATNTSSISITELAAATQRPDRFIGMHFFNPVPVMQLVEIIRGLQTSDATYQAVHALAVQLGKTPISVRNAPGFVVNRILMPMINEAFFALADGLAAPEDIDAGMKLGCNHPLGPLALADLIGLDVCLAIMTVLYEQYSDSKYRPCPLLREKVAAGWLGRKTGRGVYVYPA